LIKSNILSGFLNSHGLSIIVWMKPSHEHTTDAKVWLWIVLAPLSLFVVFLLGLNRYALPWVISLPWVPSLDIALAFRIDGLSAQMLMLITGIGSMVFVYAVGYLEHEPRRNRIFIVLLFFMLAMIGAVSADDVVVLFLFWELTSLTSFLLVGFDHTEASVRASARQALLITMGGGLALLGGLILLSQIAGSRLLSEIIVYPGLTMDARSPYAIGLVLLGAFTKSAQFPFHFWLPNAMSAPTPVSAYLHSATMVKLGIYLMARLDQAFNDLLLWEVTLVGIGTVTALWASVLALRERDLKRILARSTVSALGTLTLLIGLPSPGAGLAVVTFLFAHAIYKAPLFMVAGNIDHATGTRVIDHLMGLRRQMPWSAAVAIIAGLSMAGLPMAFGFVAKDMITLAKEQAELIGLVGYAFVAVNAVAVAVAGVAAIRVFWGPLGSSYERAHEAPWLMLLPPLVIALVGIEFEFLPHLADPLLVLAAQSISPSLEIVEVSASYALGKLLSATGMTLGIGLLLFVYWDRLHARLSSIRWLDAYGPSAAYEAGLLILSHIAAWHTRLLQDGRLDHYLRLMLVALLVMGFYVAGESLTRVVIPLEWGIQGWMWLVAAILVALGAIGAAVLGDRLAVLMASGLVGYGAAILFLFAGAPDLAFTQFGVETALVVVAAVILPRYASEPKHAPSGSLRLILALVAGLATCVLLLHLQGSPEYRELAEWYAAHSLSEAYGRNVVNVIIVDFRAMDTLGEVAVVVFVLLAALPLLGEHRSNSVRVSATPLLDLTAPPLYWLMLLVAIWILLRGHHAPGGGFVGGLVAVAASSLLATLRDPDTARRAQPLAPVLLAWVGLSLVLIGGLIGMIWGEGFLHHLWVGPLSSVLLFDLGVFCVVWGVLTGMIYTLLYTAHSRKPTEGYDA
jgi:multicomponent Na+:H+ antiporter subunit A